MSMPGFTAEASIYGSSQEVVQQFNPICVIKCAAALAQCIVSQNPAQCLVNAGMSECVQCLF